MKKVFKCALFILFFIKVNIDQTVYQAFAGMTALTGVIGVKKFFLHYSGI